MLRHQKEQLAFTFYLEQYCVCSSVKRLFSPQLSSSGVAQFQQLLGSIFDSEIVREVFQQRASAAQAGQTGKGEPELSPRLCAASLLNTRYIVSGNNLGQQASDQAEV